MLTTLEHITEEALPLSEEQRAQLAHRLLQNPEPVSDAREVESAWDAEIAIRVARVEEDTATGRPAEDVFRDIRARYH